MCNHISLHSTELTFVLHTLTTTTDARVRFTYADEFALELYPADYHKVIRGSAFMK